MWLQIHQIKQFNIKKISLKYFVIIFHDIRSWRVKKVLMKNVTYRWLFLPYLLRWKLFFPSWKLVYACYPPFWGDLKFEGNYSSLCSFSTERFGHDMKIGDTRKFTKIFLLWSFRFISDMLFTFNRVFAMSINETLSK